MTDSSTTPSTSSGQHFPLRWHTVFALMVLGMAWLTTYLYGGIFNLRSNEKIATVLFCAGALLFARGNFLSILKIVKQDPWLTALYALAPLSMLWSPAAGATLQSSLFPVSAALFSWAMFAHFGRDRSLKIMYVVLLVGLFVSAGKMIAPRPLGFDRFGQFTGIFAGKIRLGIFISIVLLARIAGVPKPRRHLSDILIIILCLLLLLINGSGTSFVAMLFGIGTAVLICSGSRSKKKALLLFVALTICSLLYLAVNPVRRQSFTKYLLTLNGRTPVWHAAGKSLVDRPIFGFGYDAYLTTDAAGDVRAVFKKQNRSSFVFLDNGYLDIASSFGVTGLLLISASLILTWRKIYRRARTTADQSDVMFELALFVFIVLANSTGAWFFVPSTPLFQCYLWLACSGDLSSESEEKSASCTG